MVALGPSSDVPVEEHDIIIVGAGLSGINTAHVLRNQMPHRSIIIVEKQPRLGGTWAFFKYPGFRSDSYMTSFGLGWHPWTKDTKMGTADDIVEYLQEAADNDGITPLIRLRHAVIQPSWRSDEQRWHLDMDCDGVRKTYIANFVVQCSGYYSYDRALETKIPGINSFAGKIVHPQWWPEDLDYSNKRIAIIGSGATTITLLPELAKTASSVTMIQRSPSYVLSMPRSPPVDALLHRWLPYSWATWISRWIETSMGLVLSEFFLACPNLARRLFMKGIKENLPGDIDVNVHFNPRYTPFQQRVGICPDGDFFQALHQNNTEIVTDTIETVYKNGIKMASGRKVEDLDIIITATGLYFQFLSGLKPDMDGEVVRVPDQYVWRGMMCEKLPNMAFVMGYVTSTWTPGANIMAHLIIRVLKKMEEKGATSVVPRLERTESMPALPVVNASSSYFTAAVNRMPKTTGKGPWYGRLNLWTDFMAYLFGNVEDGLVYAGMKTKEV